VAQGIGLVRTGDGSLPTVRFTLHGDGLDIQLSRLCTQITMHTEDVANHKRMNVALWPTFSSQLRMLWTVQGRLSQAGFAVAP
jgi:hypothetical protein